MNERVKNIKKEFPILQQKVYDKPLVYFDNAATTQKPKQVIDSLVEYYNTYNSNVHRGVHYLSQKATDRFEKARKKVKEFINAEHLFEIIFTKGTTDSINMIASSFGKKFLRKDDEIVVSIMEHHSNFVPWQQLCEEKGALLKIVNTNLSTEIDLLELENALTDKTKLLAITHVSNLTGTINPIKKIIKIAHKKNIPVLIDGAQAISHIAVDVKDLDCDFYCFSSHKMYGPLGAGVLYGKKEWLEKLPPYQSGGEMVEQVKVAGTTFNELPFKFEAGTPSIADVIGFGAAIDFIKDIGIKNIASFEEKLTNYALEELQSINGLKIIGNPKSRTSVISFIFDDIHQFDAGMIFNRLGIALRTGHHCAQPFVEHLGHDGTIRISFAAYNTIDEIDKFIDAVHQVKGMFS